MIERKVRPIFTLHRSIILGEPCILDTCIDGKTVTVKTSPVQHVIQHPDGGLTVITANTIYECPIRE